MRFVVCLCLLWTPGWMSAQIKNIQLAESKVGRSMPGDPFVIINHSKVGSIVAAMGTDQVVYTTDGGAAWNESIVTSPLGRGGSVGMIVDSKGKIYNFHRAEGEKPGEGYDHIICQRSDDFGKTWNEGSLIGGGSGKKNDKLGIAVNARKQILYASWTQYDQYPSSEAGCTSRVMFSLASNAGNKWAKPVAVSQLAGTCNPDGTSIAGATPAVSMEGRIFLAWSNNGVIYFDRSYDEGETWLFNDLPIAQQQGGWALEVPGFGTTYNAPILMIDNSASRYHGMLHLVFADQRAGAEDTDIYYHRSTRYGDSWTIPMRINQDEPGKHQFSPAMAVDQTTGHVYIVYYDRRAYDDLNTDVYVAWSTDGGASFKEKRISEKPFIASVIPFHDHTSISAHDGLIVPVWTRIDDGKPSIWTALLSDADLNAK
ncbi:MAG: exo-alpha-sialidase [Cyclobacteriaceae bacterium]|nr:exo-alpha-sialidase [Cyclobacteriaceae bacterium]